MQDIYKNRVRLLIDVLSLINWDGCFALKGGTAINFFVEPMPRLSVDIDLAYIRLTDRDSAIAEMKACLKEFTSIFSKHSLMTEHTSISSNNPVGKLKVSSSDASIIVEPNINLRGTLLPVEKRLINGAVSDLFLKETEVTILSENELYSGKLIAMLDRQHPRDIFDMYWYLKKTNNTINFLDYFIVYLVQTNRPFHEIIKPNILDISHVYEHSFKGMTESDFSLELLERTRQSVTDNLHKQLTENQIDFLISILKLAPAWDLLPFDNIDQLPGVKWRLMNIKKMPEDKRYYEIRELEKLL